MTSSLRLWRRVRYVIETGSKLERTSYGSAVAAPEGVVDREEAQTRLADPPCRVDHDLCMGRIVVFRTAMFRIVV